ncbi:hypothetical protein VNO77_36304 [Canavalia gladiata]|uniref:Uncharacterized protein n=1 Tax=Canavalia gladiata TaxID=3824 RepID=A0AAN9PVL3_CANGL
MYLDTRKQQGVLFLCLNHEFCYWYNDYFYRFVATTQPLNAWHLAVDGMNFRASDFAYPVYSLELKYRPERCLEAECESKSPMIIALIFVRGELDEIIYFMLQNLYRKGEKTATVL